MKLNFWQWLGVVLLVVGVTWWLYDRRDRGTPPPTAPSTETPAVTTAPMTPPTTAP